MNCRRYNHIGLFSHFIVCGTYEASYSGMPPTAGGIAFLGDMGGNFYALDTTNGQRL